MLFLSIPKPCHENWNEMSPREQGAFCKACSKTVIDFTVMSDEEVRAYLMERREQKTCGRFRNDQLGTESLLPQLLAASIPFWKKFLAIVFILFGSFISGCERPLKGQVVAQTPETADREVKEYTMVGVIEPEEIANIRLDTVVKEVCSSTMGFIIPEIIEDRTLIGDVEISPVENAATREIKSEPVTVIDSVKITKPPSAIIDSVKKVTPPNNCDSILTKPIEP